jgi:LysM repeat protein
MLSYASSFSQDVYPIHSFSRVHYYKLKAGFERPQFDNGIVLTPSQVKQLTDLLNTPETFEKPEFRCFDPNDVFIFYNNNNKKVARIDLGFKCRKVLAEPLIPAALEVGLGLTIDASAVLQALVAEISKPLKPSIPDYVTQMTHIVAQGDTWESIAKKYDTSADLIVAMNRKNISWTPTEGDNLMVCLHYANYEYPKNNEYTAGVSAEMTDNQPIIPEPKPKKTMSESVKSIEPKTENNQSEEMISIKETAVRPSEPSPKIKAQTSTKVNTAPIVENPVQPRQEPASDESVVMDFQGLNHTNPSKSNHTSTSDVKTKEGIKETASPQTTHIVQQGETLYAISRKYGKPVKDILAANNMAAPNIKMGQSLVIPK